PLLREGRLPRPGARRGEARPRGRRARASRRDPARRLAAPRRRGRRALGAARERDRDRARPRVRDRRGAEDRVGRGPHRGEGAAAGLGRRRGRRGPHPRARDADRSGGLAGRTVSPAGTDVSGAALRAAVERAATILVASEPLPDGDAFGSEVALRLMIQQTFGLAASRAEGRAGRGPTFVQVLNWRAIPERY